jgi:L-lactate dehydrogenase complex protein LldF
MSAMELTAEHFKENARAALRDEQLQRALTYVRGNFTYKRAAAVAALPEFETLREEARAIKDHTLADLDLYYEAYEARVREQGGHVHFAETTDDARRIILDICRRVGARSVTKGKSMISEEIGLNGHLAANGITPVETDLGEYIIQLRGETPSHIIAPAVHLTKAQVEADFRRAHTHLPPGRDLTEPVTLLSEARGILRDRFLAADVGVTGANFLVAETGSSIIVTNEGNGDLTQILPRVHIVIASIEKMVPTLADASTIFRLLARSATGQDMSVYTTVSTGPRRPGDTDGPEEYHVVVLDNGRTALLGTPQQEMLRCIRCGACMNHCPVYQAIGGHAYGATYPGPIGQALDPAIFGLETTHDLPNASTFCGRCESVCPMKIPLPALMRHWRDKEFERRLSPATQRYGIRVWAFFARRPTLYRLATRIAMRALGNLGRERGRFASLPLAGGWTRHRDMPAPPGRTFMDLYKQRAHERKAA